MMTVDHINHRIIQCPAFEVIGKKTWISAQDNALFGQFWQACQEDGLFETFSRVSDSNPGVQSGGVTLGISLVAENPAQRNFFYMIAIEKPGGSIPSGLEAYTVPSTQWAVFECWGKVPDSIVAAEMYAFMEWLPASPYEHAHAPEMEVYPPQASDSGKESYSEFWLPVIEKGLAGIR